MNVWLKLNGRLHYLRYQHHMGFPLLLFSKMFYSSVDCLQLDGYLRYLRYLFGITFISTMIQSKAHIRRDFIWWFPWYLKFYIWLNFAAAQSYSWKCKRYYRRWNSVGLFSTQCTYEIISWRFCLYIHRNDPRIATPNYSGNEFRLKFDVIFNATFHFIHTKSVSTVSIARSLSDFHHISRNFNVNIFRFKAFAHRIFAGMPADAYYILHSIKRRLDSVYFVVSKSNDENQNQVKSKKI